MVYACFLINNMVRIDDNNYINKLRKIGVVDANPYLKIAGGWFYPVEICRSYTICSFFFFLVCVLLTILMKENGDIIVNNPIVANDLQQGWYRVYTRHLSIVEDFFCFY